MHIDACQCTRNHVCVYAQSADVLQLNYATLNRINLEMHDRLLDSRTNNYALCTDNWTYVTSMAISPLRALLTI